MQMTSITPSHIPILPNYSFDSSCRISAETQARYKADLELLAGATNLHTKSLTVKGQVEKRTHFSIPQRWLRRAFVVRDSFVIIADENKKKRSMIGAATAIHMREATITELSKLHKRDHVVEISTPQNDIYQLACPSLDARSELVAALKAARDCTHACVVATANLVNRAANSAGLELSNESGAFAELLAASLQRRGSTEGEEIVGAQYSDLLHVVVDGNRCSLFALLRDSHLCLYDPSIAPMLLTKPQHVIPLADSDVQAVTVTNRGKDELGIRVVLSKELGPETFDIVCENLAERDSLLRKLKVARHVTKHSAMTLLKLSEIHQCLIPSIIDEEAGTSSANTSRANSISITPLEDSE